MRTRLLAVPIPAQLHYLRLLEVRIFLNGTFDGLLFLVLFSSASRATSGTLFAVPSQDTSSTCVSVFLSGEEAHVESVLMPSSEITESSPTAYRSNLAEDKKKDPTIQTTAATKRTTRQLPGHFGDRVTGHDLGVSGLSHISENHSAELIVGQLHKGLIKNLPDHL